MDEQTLAEKKEEFLRIFRENVTRAHSENLLNYLLSEECDFFEAPASTRYHGAYRGGLLEHSLNVYHCLKAYLERERVKEVYHMDYSEESIAIVALLHDVCKTNFYTIEYRNRKQGNKWVQVPTYTIHDTLPYGHGEKSVFIIQFFMRLLKEEAMAIRWHMGFSAQYDDPGTIGKALESYPLAFALCVADMEATYFLEGKTDAI